MKSLTNYIINEALSKNNKKQILTYINDLEEYLKDIIPSLNQMWKNEFKDFNSDSIEDCYNDCKDCNLKYYKGFSERSGEWKDGYFSRYNSCWKDNNIKETINNLNKKDPNDPHLFSYLFSTCCEYLESQGYDDPQEWTLIEFRQVDTALSIIINKLK